MTTATFTTRHRNILAELADELEREAKAAQRAGDRRHNGELPADALYQRGAQDALFNAAGRIRSILIAPLSTIVDVGEVFDEVEARLGGNDATSSTKLVTPHTAARVAAEVIDGRNVRGAA